MNDAVKYNISYLEKISNENEVFIREMIGTFISNTPLYLTEIDMYYTNKKMDLLYKAIHKFIPTLAFVSDQAYISKFDKLEKLAFDKKDNDEMRELLNELIIYSNQIVEQLKADYNL